MSFAEMNNRTVEAWQTGQTQEALSLLQSVLGELIQRVNQRKEQVAARPAPEKWTCIEGPPPVVALDPMNIYGGDSTALIIHETSPASFLELYTRPLLVGRTNGGCTDENKENLLSAVVLFNMALANHMHGLSTMMSFMDRPDDESLPKARRLYHLSFKVANSCMHTPDLLFLAIYNNLAHLDCHHTNLKAMNESLEEMRYILVGHSVDDDVTTIDNSDLRLFFNNSKDEPMRAAAA